MAPSVNCWNDNWYCLFGGFIHRFCHPDSQDDTRGEANPVAFFLVNFSPAPRFVRQLWILLFNLFFDILFISVLPGVCVPLVLA